MAFFQADGLAPTLTMLATVAQTYNKSQRTQNTTRSISGEGESGVRTCRERVAALKPMRHSVLVTALAVVLLLQRADAHEPWTGKCDALPRGPAAMRYGLDQGWLDADGAWLDCPVTAAPNTRRRTAAIVEHIDAALSMISPADVRTSPFHHVLFESVLPWTAYDDFTRDIQEVSMIHSQDSDGQVVEEYKSEHFGKASLSNPQFRASPSGQLSWLLEALTSGVLERHLGRIFLPALRLTLGRKIAESVAKGLFAPADDAVAFSRSAKSERLEPPHIDFPEHQLFSCLLYGRTTDDLRSGGGLQLFQYAAPAEVRGNCTLASACPAKWPPFSHLLSHSRVEYEPNRMVCMLNDDTSVHTSEPSVNVTRPRHFALIRVNGPCAVHHARCFVNYAIDNVHRVTFTVDPGGPDVATQVSSYLTQRGFGGATLEHLARNMMNRLPCLPSMCGDSVGVTSPMDPVPGIARVKFVS